MVQASPNQTDGERLVLLAPLELRLDERDLLADGNRAQLTVREFQVLEVQAEPQAEVAA
jgi:DNA-binding response OmpR family regulator